MNTTEPALLETRGLSMHFGGVAAVNNVNFRLSRGELRCLIGPNGAGKSTFFKCLTGQLRPTTGSVMFKGRDMTGAESHTIARAGIGIKTQVPSVFDGLSVYENVYLSAYRAVEKLELKRYIDEVLNRLSITHLSNRTVGQLAHGQRQLVELASVLAAKPELILLDEPAAGMTQEETDRTAALIREINKEHALIVVEHDMQFIRKIAKTVTVFYQGSILMEDVADAVLKDSRVRDIYLGKQAA